MVARIVLALEAPDVTEEVMHFLDRTGRARVVGTAVDGDVIFAVSSGSVPVPDPLRVELLAQDLTAAAIERGVTQAEGLGPVPGLADRA